MSINMYVGEVRQQVQSINSSCQSTVATMEQIQQALITIIIEPGLKGATYDSMKNYFNTVYMPVTKGFILVCERMIEANQQFLNRYLDQVDVNSLQESVLEERIRQYNRLSEMLDSIVDPVGFNARMIDGLQDMRQQTIRKLDSLREYDYFSMQIFDELEAQLATLEAGITVLSEGKAWNQTTGTISTMGLNLDWSNTINEGWKQREKAKQNELQELENAAINNLKKYGLTKDDLVQVDDTAEEVYQKYLKFANLGLHPHTGLPLTDSEKVKFQYAAHAGTLSDLIGIVGGAYAANKAFNANVSKNSKTVTSKKDSGANGTVWDDIKGTQPPREGTTIPKSFEINANGEKLWVNPNGTKHMVEYSTRNLSHGRKFTEQQLLRSFQGAVEQATSTGIKFNTKIIIDNWELIFSPAREAGQLPVIKHAVYLP